MTIHAFYRLAIWLPMVFPTTYVLFLHGLGYRPAQWARPLAHLLLLMFFYGGFAYTPLALWATRWVGRRPEATIVRLALAAPLLMVGAFMVLTLCLFIGIGNFETFLAFSAVGVRTSLLVGYFFVALVLLMRLALGGLGLLPTIRLRIGSTHG